MFSLLPDKGATKRIGATFFRMARANLERRYEKRHVTFGFEELFLLNGDIPLAAIAQPKLTLYEM
jgi:hypothetical protein